MESLISCVDHAWHSSIYNACRCSASASVLQSDPCKWSRHWSAQPSLYIHTHTSAAKVRVSYLLRARCVHSVVRERKGRKLEKKRWPSSPLLVSFLVFVYSRPSSHLPLPNDRNRTVHLRALLIQPERAVENADFCDVHSDPVSIGSTFQHI